MIIPLCVDVSSKTIVISIYDGDDQTEKSCLLQCEIILSSLKFIGNSKLLSSGSLPLNSFFFSTDLGIYITDELDLQLQKNGISLSANCIEQIESRDVEDKERNASLNSEIASSTNLLEQLRSCAVSKIDSSLQEYNRDILNGSKKSLHDKLQAELNRMDHELKTELIAEKNDQALLRRFVNTEAIISNCQALETEEKKVADLCRLKREENVRLKFLFEVRQLKLISEIQAIYPIEKSEGNDYSIRGLDFPADHTTVDDDHISSVLGYICHLLILLSKYLELSLRYPVAYASSKSLIRDPILAGLNNATGTGPAATLPLYRKGVDRDKFEKAIILLQRNVEHVVRSVGLEYKANKSLLYNLNEIFIHEICPNFEI